MFIDHDFSPLSSDRETAAPTTTNWRVCAAVLLLFILGATFSAIRKDVTQGFDEVAHTSYIAYLQRSGEVWPAFEKLRMLDPSSFQFTDKPNYLDHPSPYYLLLAHLGPRLEGHPQAILVHRLFNVALAAIGLAALMAIGLIARLPRPMLYAYIVPLACIPVLVPIAGAISNDNAAFAGGAIATLAALQLLITGSRAWLLAALGGVILASWAKFTALLLAGGLVAGVLLWLLWRGRLPARWIGPIVIAALLACAPYVVLFAQYGSPTPETPGQIALMKTFQTVAMDLGWYLPERLTPVSYAARFIAAFVEQWMPTLEPRNALNYAALTLPVIAVLCAIAGILVTVRRIAQGKPSPLDIVIAAGAMALAVTFLLHGIFSYQLHMEFGVVMTAYPRYYLPLAALVPLAGLSLLGAIQQPSVRAGLLVFLIANPVVFRLLGGPFW